MFARRTLLVLFLVTLAMSAFAGAVTKVARYGYAVTQFWVLPYAVDPNTGYLRFTAEQDLQAPPCSGYGQVALAPSQKFLYLPSSCGEVVATSIGVNGILTPIAGSPLAIGTSLWDMVITPSGKFAYVTDISAYPTVSVLPVSVNTKSGVLTQLSGAVSYTASQDPIMVMDPQGKFLYILDMNNGVYVYALNAVTGALTAVAGSPFATGGFEDSSIAVYPGGKLLIAANYGSRSISVFKVNRTTGALTLAAGSPYSTSGYPYSLAVDPASPHFIFAGYASFNSAISVFRLSAKGALTEVPGSPFQTLGTYESIGLTTDPTGKFLYSVTGSGSGSATWEQVLSVDASTGALAPLQTISLPFGGSSSGPGLIFTTGTTPVSITPTYAYAANSPVPTSAPDDIVEYSVNPSSGALAQLGTVGDINGPQHLLLSPSGTNVYATDNGNVIGYNVQSNGSLQSFTSAQASLSAILVDPNAAFIYFAAGGEAGDWFLDPATGQIVANFGAYYFPGNVVGMTNSVGSYYDFVISDAGTLSEIYRGSNTGATTGVFSVGNAPSAVAMDGGGRFVYVANRGDNTISGFVTYGDSLQPLNSGTAFPSGTAPSALVGDAHGFYLYVANSGSHDLWAYSIDPVSGNLTQVGTPVAVGNGPVSLNVDYSGKFLYCANSGDGTISTFTINANGTLTPSGTVIVDSSPSTPAPTSIVSTGTYQ